MLSANIVKMLNEQVNKELYSAYLYLDISGYYADEGLNGFENWFYIQTQEERDHAMLIRTYLLNNGASVTLDAIAKPDKVFANHKAPLEAALAHEEFVTASIHNIYAEAQKENDYRTMQFLDWFVKEQGEEEKNTNDLIKKFELFGTDAKSLYLLDSEMASRVYSAPSLTL